MATGFGRASIARDTPKIAPKGIDSTIRAGAPEYVRWPRWVAPRSMEAPQEVPGKLRVRLMGGYNPPPSASLILNWFGEPYSPPPAGAIKLEFGALGYGYVWPAMGDVSAFGLPALALPAGLRPDGIHPGPFGATGIQTLTNSVRATGFRSDEFGAAHLRNTGVAVRPGAIGPAALGTPYIWNLLQFLRASGFDASAAGKAFVSGGVKAVTPAGLAAPSMSSPLVINTTANQSARPRGIEPPKIDGPSVSPRTLFAYGVAPGGYGIALVQRNPAPSGFDGLLLGLPTIEQRTKYLSPAGIEAGEGGFPRAFDPTLKLFVSSVLQAGVFGDTRIANRSMFVRVPGSDFLELSPWAYLENTRRPLLVAGQDCAAFGNALIANKSPSIAPLGFNALVGPLGVGIGYDTRHVEPRGVDFLRLGAPALTKTPEIAPRGFAGAAGMPTIWPRVRVLEALGRDAQVFGKPSVWFRYRFVAGQGFDAGIYGNPVVERVRRELLARGSQHSAHGAVLVENADRTLAPPSIWNNFAHSHMVGGLRYLRPPGFDAARFGSRIIPEIQPLYPLGFVAPFGIPALRSSWQIVAPPSITTGVQPADRWGAARAWNLLQYITLQFDPDSALNPPTWPQWTRVENRNRTIRTSGEQAARIGMAQIDNKARPLLPTGIEAPGAALGYLSGLVAYRVRPLRLEGLEAPYLSSWGRIHNSAAVLHPRASDLSLWGAPTVENTRRRFERIGGFDAAWCGYPMVAERVRTLSFEGRYTIAPPAIRLPGVKLHTRYVDGVGVDTSGIGWASLSIHWTLITPRWTLQNLYGSPAVRNLTPELGTKGRTTEEFGDQLVRLQWRPVAPDGAGTQLFGRTVIAYRDRSVSVAGLRAWAFGDRLTVVKTGAPPYSMQSINLDGEWQDGRQIEPGHGIGPPEDAKSEHVGRPTINQHVIYPEQKDPSTEFGSPRVTANSIRVEPGYSEHLIGEPFVGNRVRQIGVKSIKESSTAGWPRLSPHTIYAVVEAPYQAQLNHPLGGIKQRHYVNGYLRDPGITPGNPSVTLRDRVILTTYRQVQWIEGETGRPRLTLKRHYIEPRGFATFRSGWHTFPGDQQIVLFGSIDPPALGQARLDRLDPPGPRHARPTGFISQAFGNAAIDLLHRRIRPTGLYATLMGTGKSGDRPFMWQGLRVGPHVPNIAGGFQCDMHGEPLVSYRVREAAAQGFDAFLCEYQLEAFDRRMRVTRREPYRPPTPLAPAGIEAATYGTPDARPALHFIRPDGNADQYRKGAF